MCAVFHNICSNRGQVDTETKNKSSAHRKNACCRRFVLRMCPEDGGGCE